MPLWLLNRSTWLAIAIVAIIAFTYKQVIDYGAAQYQAGINSTKAAQSVEIAKHQAEQAKLIDEFNLKQAEAVAAIDAMRNRPVPEVTKYVETVITKSTCKRIDNDLLRLLNETGADNHHAKN